MVVSGSMGDNSWPRADTTFFAGTFCKHPLTMATTYAVLNEIKRRGPQLQIDLNSKTDAMVSTLNQFFDEHDISIKMVNCGSLFRFVFSSNLDAFFYLLINKGLYVWEGRNCFLSSAHTQTDIDKIIDIVKESAIELKHAGFFESRPKPQPATRLNEKNANRLPVSAIDADIATHTSQPKTFHLTEAQKQL